MPKTCCNCRNFYAGEFCRRYPPIAAQGYPKVLPADSCGEWRPLADNVRAFSSLQKINEADVLRVIRASTTHSGLFADFAREIMKKHQVCRRTAEERLKRMVHAGLLIQTEDDGVRYIEIEEKADLEFGASEGTPAPEENGQQSKIMHTFEATILPVMIEAAPTLSHAKSYSDLHRRCGKMGRGSFDRCLKEGIVSAKIARTDAGLYYLTP